MNQLAISPTKYNVIVLQVVACAYDVYLKYKH